MFRQISETLKDDLARKRSGGQITESEFVRLNRLVPDWKGPPETYKARLKGYAKGVDTAVKNYRRSLGEAGYIVPGVTQVQGPKSVDVGRQVKSPSNKQKLDALNAASRELPGATQQQIAIRAREILDNR